MSKYKPMLISFDEEAYKNEVKAANQKVEVYNLALAWVGKYVTVESPKAFAESFTEVFKQLYYDSMKGLNLLDLSPEKLLEAKEINVSELSVLEARFNNLSYPCKFNRDGVPFVEVDKAQFEHWTKSSKENQVLRDSKNLIDAVERMEQHTHIYPQQIMLATSSLIGYDIRRSRYKVNIGMLNTRA
jgi:hypothetical protein